MGKGSLTYEKSTGDSAGHIGAGAECLRGQAGKFGYTEGLQHSGNGAAAGFCADRRNTAARAGSKAHRTDLNALTDATVAASFGADDISETDGKTELTLTVYDYDIYDMVDIAQLAVGDTIVVDGKDMVVTSREDENGFVTINGGLEQGGVDLTSDDSGVYYAVGLDDTKSYHELGKVTVPVAEGFVLTDNADPEHPDETYAAADLAELAASEPGFTANNTLATIEHGKLTVLARSYTP